MSSSALIVLRALLNAIFLRPFLAAQLPGSEHIGQALRFCLSDLVKMKVVPARTCSAREFGLDLDEKTLNTKGAGLHGWLVLSRAAFVLSRATRSAISSIRAALDKRLSFSMAARIRRSMRALPASPSTGEALSSSGPIHSSTQGASD